MRKIISLNVRKKVGKVFWILGGAVLVLLFLFSYIIMSSDASWGDFFERKEVQNSTGTILVDVGFLKNRGGVYILTENIIKLAAQKYPNRKFVVFTSDYSHQNFAHLSQFKNIKVIWGRLQYDVFKDFAARILNVFTFDAFESTFLQLVLFNDILLKETYDICWFPDCPKDMLKVAKLNIPQVITVHDLCPYPKKTYTSRIACIGNRIAQANKVITVSNFSKKAIDERFNLKGDLCKVIPIRLARRFTTDNASPEKTQKVLQSYGILEKKYLIFPAAFWANKNHSNLLKAFANFVGKNPLNIKLLFVGTHTHEIVGVKKTVKECGIEDNVVFTDFVTDDTLHVLLCNALAFVSPSLYEGFGMPIVEAMAAGVPVICSNAGSIPEVAGNAAIFFDPLNIDEMTQAIFSIVTNADLRQELIRLGYEQAKKFSDADAMIDEYIKVFDEVITFH